MQFNQTIVTSDNLLNTFAEIGTDRATHLKLQLDLIQKNIASLLSSYHWAEKGVVEALRIDADSIVIDEQGNGKFKVNYAINIHYGCSDIDVDLDKSMVITIQTNLVDQKAILTGEYFPEREPDEF